ncbi:hypothetical protein [uncultured Limimaricola sp.]|uniref:hypothetical protein n=1 Tax=uncultured Limimaricola sp. TaxID=2211667 RepID=UPI0030F4DDA7
MTGAGGARLGASETRGAGSTATGGSGIVSRTPGHGNRLIERLDPSHPIRCDGLLDYVDLPQGTRIENAGQAITQVVFPVSGVVSVVATGPGGQAVEAGLVGREGMTAHTLVLNGDRAANDMMMQIAGAGWRIDAAALCNMLDDSSMIARCATCCCNTCNR